MPRTVAAAGTAVRRASAMTGLDDGALSRKGILPPGRYVSTSIDEPLSPHAARTQGVVAMATGDDGGAFALRVQPRRLFVPAASLKPRGAGDFLTVTPLNR